MFTGTIRLSSVHPRSKLRIEGILDGKDETNSVLIVSTTKMEAPAGPARSFRNNYYYTTKPLSVCLFRP
jgi:predicted transcriptional regulator